MKLVRLVVNNFMSIGSIDLVLDKTGMNLVLGKNLDDKRFDSNGSAKSALFEAMTWGLFGEFLRDLSVESVIRNGQDKVIVEVLVDPEDGSERVWFSRSRTKREHVVTVLTEKGIQLFPANSVKDIQPQINNWLGLDFKTFTNSVYFGKGLVKFFMASNDNERKDLLETILQLVSFDDALERAKGLSKKCVEDISEHNTSIAISNALNVEKNASLSSLERTFKELSDKVSKEIPAIQKKISSLRETENKLMESAEKMDFLINKEKTTFNENYNKVSAEHVQKSFELDNTLNTTLSNLEFVHDSIIDNIKSEHKVVIDKINEGYEELKGIFNHFEVSKRQAEKEIAKTNGIIQNLEKERSRINSLTENLPCKECYQNVSIEHKVILTKKYTEEILPLKDHVRDMEEEYATLEKDTFLCHTRPKKALEDRHANISDLHSSIIVQKQMEKKSALEETHRKISKKKSEVSQGYISLMKNLQTEHQNKITDWVKLKGEYTVDITKVQAEIASLGNKEKSIEEAYTSLKGKIVDVKKDIDRVAKQAIFSKEKIDAIGIIKERTDFWIEGFGPRGIKSFIFESALPYLTARTNHYSSYITGGTVAIDILPTTVVKSTGNVKEKLTVSAKNIHGASIYQGNSDGERRRIDICVLLALQDLISTRATKNWNTLIFDEIFDALDKTGIEHVIDLMRTFKNKSIYIISHSEDIKKHFDTAVIIQKKDGVSSIKEIL